MSVTSLNEAVMFLSKEGYVVHTSEGYIPEEMLRSEVLKKGKCVFKGNNAKELIQFAMDVKKHENKK